MTMLETDHAIRERLLKAGVLSDGYHPEMQRIHRENAELLLMILDEHGWPSLDLVGPEGTAAAWTILQHAIENPQLLKRGIKMINELGEKSGVSPADQARTIDRIRVFEGKQQLYGTNFDWDEQSLLSPTPIEDEKNVDLRRAEVRLCPLQEAIKTMRVRAAIEGNKPPKDPVAKRQEFELWLRLTGWRS